MSICGHSNNTSDSKGGGGQITINNYGRPGQERTSGINQSYNEALSGVCRISGQTVTLTHWADQVKEEEVLDLENWKRHICETFEQTTLSGLK